jgi:hypothetical protein
MHVPNGMCKGRTLHNAQSSAVLLQDFYGEQLRLVVCGYVRPEEDFKSLEALKARIMQDAEVTRVALKHESLLALSKDPFLSPTPA